MGIWQTQVDLNIIRKRAHHSMSQYLGIEFTDIGEDYLAARMPVDHRTKQPFGIMHGGASCVLAETVGSTAAQFCVNPDLYYCVGLEINTNHIHAVRDGFVIAIAKPYHIGKSTQVWGIEIKSEALKLVSINRLTLAVLTKKTIQSPT